MCELLGMSFNLPVRPNISFRGFRHRGETNPDGWGIAFYPDESAQILKEPIKAKSSSLSKFLQDYQELQSKIFVAHVRKASKGPKSHRNTHPFHRELNGKEYVFAHNGTIIKTGLELGRFKPIGETDSERAFCHLLNLIEARGITEWNNEGFDWIAEKLQQINQYGDFNCIFSDGENLFCYHDKNGYNGLCFTQRKPPYGQIQLLDEDWKINLAEEKDPEQTGYIIATRRLTNEPWHDFKFSELIVFKHGKMIYSNRRNTTEKLVHSLTKNGKNKPKDAENGTF
ncbi:MAG: class II glutamine amidotransferase [Candidatus Jordarchaeaceae archaeon]